MHEIGIEPIYLINDKNHILSQDKLTDHIFKKLVFGIILKEMKIS